MYVHRYNVSQGCKKAQRDDGCQAVTAALGNCNAKANELGASDARRANSSGRNAQVA